jgi:hypothetical protein
MEERRESRRVERAFPVACRRIPDRAWFAGALRDITGQGLRLQTPHEVAPGDTLGLAIDLEDRLAPLQVEGAVVWRAGNQLGVRFTRISHGDVRFYRLCFPDKDARPPV